jgi:quinol monooxygenase YgiN
MCVMLKVQIISKPGRGQELAQLIQPVSVHNEIDGCSGMEVFTNNTNSDEIMIIEYWDSVEKHKTFVSGVEKSGGLGKILELSENVVRNYFIKAD